MFAGTYQPGRGGLLHSFDAPERHVQLWTCSMLIGQIGCINCDDVGDVYQEMPHQTSCLFCPANTQRYAGVMTAANITACQCKKGA